MNGTLQNGGLGRRITKEYKTELSMLAIFVVFFALLWNRVRKEYTPEELAIR